MKLEFPKGFLWGSATSSHQVEGGNFNDWTEWEKKNADKLVRKAKTFWHGRQKKKFPEMFESKNYISDKACDHYNRYEQDFDIVKELGHNAHRFSIEWSRIEPEEGKFDEKEIRHYKDVVEALRARGIEPLVTLYHWTMPVWFAKKGGWLNKDAYKYFERYVNKVVSQLSKLNSNSCVNFWVTINEPQIYSFNSFLKGVRPPQMKNPFRYYKVLKNLVLAHKKAYRVIKKINPGAQVGIGKNNIYFEYTSFVDYFWNRWFLNKIKKHQNFIGLQYYFHSCLFGNKSESVTDMGWEIYPKGIYHVLKELKRYKKPIYITENGLADADDSRREKFIKEHLQWVHKSIEGGVDVRGYFYWSLLDNFEWDKGYWPRFGLVEVNFETQERKIRPSAYKYAEICKNNTLDF